MCDLAAIYKATKDKDEVPLRRPGEWQKMKSSHHKTSDSYGELTKWVSPGTVEAIKVYLMLPGKKSNLLLEPAKKDSKMVSVAASLRRFGASYWPKFQPPACNLVRKRFHTALYKMARFNKAFELLSKVDAHSKEVAEKELWGVQWNGHHMNLLNQDM
eukprot:9799947-Lingulodinium_polyedra.AAC.1